MFLLTILTKKNHFVFWEPWCNIHTTKTLKKCHRRIEICFIESWLKRSFDNMTSPGKRSRKICSLKRTFIISLAINNFFVLKFFFCGFSDHSVFIRTTAGMNIFIQNITVFRLKNLGFGVVKETKVITTLYIVKLFSYYDRQQSIYKNYFAEGKNSFQ